MNNGKTFDLYKSITLAFILFFSGTLIAANQHVLDYSKQIDPNLIKQYDQLLHEIEIENKIRITGIVLPELGKDKPSEIRKYFLEQVQNQEPKLEKIVLLIISLKEPYVEIVPSDSLREIYMKENISEITDKIKLSIAQQNYPEMLQNGIGGITFYYNQGKKDKERSSGMNLVMNNLFLILVVIAVFVAMRFFKKKSK